MAFRALLYFAKDNTSDSGEASAAAALGLSCAGQAGRLDVSGWGRIADRTPTSWWITVL